MRISSIVPRFFPVIDGIGDYALCLGRLMRENIGVDTRFIVADPGWYGPDRVEGFEVTHLSRRISSDLIDLLPRAPGETVLLHYEGYGYAQRGCPVWLVTALEKWRKEIGARSLLIFFHELYASGPPWTSAYWLSPLQKNLTTRLARLSDQRITNLAANAQTLEALCISSHAQTRSLPVYSNVGEAEAPRPLKQRRRRLVVFGTPGRRTEVYKRSTVSLNRICHRLGIEEVLDLGQPIDRDCLKDLEVRSSVAGLRSSGEVSEFLSDSIVGVVDYPAKLLAKSGIFAAYCAHKLIPIVATHGDATAADGLEADSNYWPIDARIEQTLDAGQAIADRALDWYRGHDLSTHARVLAECLGVSGVSASTNGTRLKPASRRQVLIGEDESL